MTDLPFEHDSLELIEACAEALDSIELYEQTAARAAEQARTENGARRGAAPGLLTDGPMRRAASSPEEAEQTFLWDLPLPPSVPTDAEALSRAYERDARRYEAT